MRVLLHTHVKESQKKCFKFTLAKQVLPRELVVLRRLSWKTLPLVARQAHPLQVPQLLPQVPRQIYLTQAADIDLSLQA